MLPLDSSLAPAVPCARLIPDAASPFRRWARTKQKRFFANFSGAYAIQGTVCRGSPPVCRTNHAALGASSVWVTERILRAAVLRSPGQEDKTELKESPRGSESSANTRSNIRKTFMVRIIM